MLVLTRKIEQEIVLGNNIKLRVLSLRGNTVRIGIDAPEDVRIRRGELTEGEAQLPTTASFRLEPAEVELA
jgi:carbon storage regulator CsrA